MGFKTLHKINDLLAAYVNIKIRLARVIFDIRNSRFTNEELDRIIYECERARPSEFGPDGERGERGAAKAASSKSFMDRDNEYWHDFIFHPCDACASHNGPKV